MIEQLRGMSEGDYEALRLSGMLYSVYPESTGNYWKDVRGIDSIDQGLPKMPTVDDAEWIRKYFEEQKTFSTPNVWETDEESDTEDEGEYTGGSSSYYVVAIENPTREHVEPYEAECNDIIEALDMNYAEGNVFKAIWRRCAERTLGKKKKGNNSKYDAEKIVFFSGRILSREK